MIDRLAMTPYIPWIIPGEFPWTSDEFEALSWDDGKLLLDELIARIPERIDSLHAFISSTPGYESWPADGSEDSLAQLGPWYRVTIPRRPPTPEDIASSPGVRILNPNLSPEIIAHIRNWPRTGPKWVYADEALARSVCADIGIYMARGLQQINAEARWSRTRDRRDLDYNYPLLRAFMLNFNPLSCTWTAARRLCESPDGPGDEFLRLFRVYAEYASRRRPPKPVPIPKRDGEPAGTRCPTCSFTFNRVHVPEGIYCNHCGQLELSAPSGTP